MADYKLFLLDRNGRVYASFDLKGAGDEQAIKAAHEYEPGAPKELWQGTRVVKRFGIPESVDAKPSAPADAKPAP